MWTFCISEKSADWLISTGQIRPKLASLFSEIHEIYKDVRNSNSVMIIDNKIRMIIDRHKEVIAFWNVDYLNETGIENWGVIVLEEPMGLLAEKNNHIQAEVFETCLQIIDFRLKNQFLPDVFDARRHPNGIMTCNSGTQGKSHKMSLAFFSKGYQFNHSAYNVCCVLGPSNEKQEKIAGILNGLSYSNLGAEINTVFNNSGNYSIQRENGFSKALNIDFEIQDEKDIINRSKIWETLNWTYIDWLNKDNGLTSAQQKIVQGNSIDSAPLRLIGAAGSGKTLILELLTIKMSISKLNKKILFIVHSNDMAESILDRFTQLLSYDDSLTTAFLDKVEIKTLMSLCKETLEINVRELIDIDANESKQMQRSIIEDSLKNVLDSDTYIIQDLPVIGNIIKHQAIIELLSTEIGISIKGHGFSENMRNYVYAEAPLSRFHGSLNENERCFVYDVFKAYQVRLESSKVFDTDDIAISYLSYLETPLWQRKRNDNGWDYVFVDEVQLFNENERRILPLLTKKNRDFNPLIFALDIAQELRGSTTARLGILGLNKVNEVRIKEVFRSPQPIVDLAFYVIQHTSDLFSTDFPDYTKDTRSLKEKEQNFIPVMITEPSSSSDFGEFISKLISPLRRKGNGQIAIIIHSHDLWDNIFERASEKKPNEVISLLNRGARIGSEKKIIITMPEFVGGQEFDAVICVGLESGRVPVQVDNNAPMNNALKERAFREMYISFTRAKKHLVIAISKNNNPTGIINDALAKKLITELSVEQFAKRN